MVNTDSTPGTDVFYPVAEAFFAMKSNLALKNILIGKGINMDTEGFSYGKTYESFFKKLLNYSDIRPLLMGVHPELDKMIHERYNIE